MGDAKERRGKKKKTEPDRLAEAIAKKIEELTVDERELHIHKWNLHTSLELMGTLGDILKQMVAGIGPQMDIASFFQGDIGELLIKHEENIVKILAGTLVVGNFESIKEAGAWIRDLGAGDVLRIFVVIAKQNIRPLVEAVGEIASELRGKISAVAVQKASRQRTS